MQPPRWRALADFLASPIGAGTRGRGWALWCSTSGLVGAIVWGSPDEPAIRDAVAAIQFAKDDRLPRYDGIVDVRYVERIDEAGVGQFLMLFADERNHGILTKLQRVCIVRARKDVIGAVVSGVMPASSVQRPIAMVDDLNAAGETLGVPAALLETIAQEAMAADGFLAAVRRVIDRALPQPDSDRVAAELGLSKRTLQRRITEEGSTFRDEVRAARLRRACHRLLTTDDKVVAIALECGFPSSQNFATAFRAVHQMSPSEYRDTNSARASRHDD